MLRGCSGNVSKLIDVIIPAYNEEDCMDELALRLTRLFSLENTYSFRVFVIENGSTDSTWGKCKIIANQDSRFKIIKLSRNFEIG